MTATTQTEQRTSERGFTLIEFLMAMFVFSILSTMVLAISGRFFSVSTSASEIFNNTSTAQNVMDRLTKELRAAVYEGSSPPTPIISTTPTSLSFYAALGAATGPTEVMLTLSNKTLTESDYPAVSNSGSTWTYSTTAQTTVISSHVVNPSGTALFTYYPNNSNTPIVPQTLTTPETTSTIESIGIDLVVQQGATGNAATLASEVHLLNVDYAS